MASQYRRDAAGMRALLSSEGMSRAAVDAANRGKRAAEAVSPVKTGRYRGSFVVTPNEQRIRGENRAGALLSNTAPHAHLVERQSRVLSRAIDAIERP